MPEIEQLRAAIDIGNDLRQQLWDSLCLGNALLRECSEVIEDLQGPSDACAKLLSDIANYLEDQEA